MKRIQVFMIPTQTDGQTDGRTDEQGESRIPPPPPPPPPPPSTHPTTVSYPKVTVMVMNDWLAAVAASTNWKHKVIPDRGDLIIIHQCCTNTIAWSPNATFKSPGRPRVATVISLSQWTLLVGQRRHTGGRREAEASRKLIHNVFNSTYFLRGNQWPTTVHLFCDHGDACAFLLPPLSDLGATNFFGDLCATEHAQNFTASMASMARSEHPVCHPWTTKANFQPPLCLQRRPGQFCSSTREAQKSRPLCKAPFTQGCDHRATFERREKWSGCSPVA